MSNVAVVVQRCHESIAGGSESLAWQYAALLKDAYRVDVLTTTALDYSDWANVLPAGDELRDGVNIRRFHVTHGRSSHWFKLYQRLQNDFHAQDSGGHRALGEARPVSWTMSLQEEFIRHQGPYSQPLLDYLREKWSTYRTVIFVTYLYPTTYFGLMNMPPGRALLVPTLHDEPPAYFSAYRHVARRTKNLLWLTDAERQLGADLWGDLPGRVVSMAVDTTLRTPAREGTPYLLYCGRIDPNKGFPELFEHFIRYKQQHPSPLRLVLTGEDALSVPERPDIEYRGFVPAEEKFSLMAGAKLFVMPSNNESFSIVTLEALAQCTPVLSSGGSEVLVAHITQSGAGRIYNDYQSFSGSLAEMLADEAARVAMGMRGREYVVSQYGPERIRALLIEAVEAKGEPATDTTARDEKTTPAARASGPQPAPPLAIPAGWSEDTLRELVTSVLVEDGPPAELRNYAAADFKRFLYTLGLVPETPGLSVLEMGANPYFTTTLLRKFREVDLHLSNFFGLTQKEGSQVVTVHQTGETETYSYKHFNIEQETFPYADETFDIILCCEILEHLVADPVHALVEIRRVLKHDGLLVLTTPNVARLNNVFRLIDGQNIYDPYSGYGVYGRHNREYTIGELHELLTANGFQVETHFTADVHAGYAGSTSAINIGVKELTSFRQVDLGQYIFSRSRVAEGAKELPPVRPEWLYRSFHDSRRHET